jgi:hypothetical protein
MELTQKNMFPFPPRKTGGDFTVVSSDQRFKSGLCHTSKLTLGTG